MVIVPTPLYQLLYYYNIIGYSNVLSHILDMCFSFKCSLHWDQSKLI